ncbi:MAG: cytochrome C [Pseudomonadales bacterium]|nr:cytochrome c [Pseudomonadales bacterium]
MNEILSNETDEMTHQHMFNRNVALGLIAATMVSISAATWADENTGIKPLALRTIMQALGKNMQTVTDAISREDWALVTKTAPLIADHPQPPLKEKMRILSFAGADMRKFKLFDTNTHQAAKEMEAFAREQDGKAVILTFATLQNSCLACHQRFRKPFKEYFYEQQ